MKPGRTNKRPQVENPVWCDHCRVRIAPYEEIATAGARCFHARCFQKEKTTKSQNELVGDGGFTLALA